MKKRFGHIDVSEAERDQGYQIILEALAKVVHKIGEAKAAVVLQRVHYGVISSLHADKDGEDFHFDCGLRAMLVAAEKGESVREACIAHDKTHENESREEQAAEFLRDFHEPKVKH